MKNNKNKQLEEIVKGVVENKSIAYYGIGGFSRSELDLLSQYAKEYDAVIMIEFEQNKVHQGALLQIMSKDAAIDYLKW